MNLRLVVIDDEIFVRKAIMTSIDWGQHNIEVVGEAHDGKSGLQVITATRPHIVITDIRMPNMDGLQLIRETKERLPHTKFLILSVLEEFQTVREALQLGVVDYVHKLSMTPEELLGAVLHIKQTHFQDIVEEQCPQAKELPLDYEGFLHHQALSYYFSTLEQIDDELAAGGFEQLFPASIPEDYPQQLVRDEVYHWISSIALFVKERGGHLQAIIGNVSPFDQISRLAAYTEIREWCCRLHQVVISHLQSLRNMRRPEVQRAIDYMQQHYMKAIRIKEVAEYVHLSENHFSIVFTKETGKTYSQYLHDIRIEKAVDMLQLGELNWVEVGGRVGFYDPKYFTKVFKKQIGVTPKQYLLSRR